MSLILEALNRADRERQLEQKTPQLHTAAVAIKVPTRVNHLHVIILLMAIMLFISLALYFKLAPSASDNPIGKTEPLKNHAENANSSQNITITNDATLHNNPGRMPATLTTTKHSVSTAVSSLYEAKSKSDISPAAEQQQAKPALKNIDSPSPKQPPLLSEMAWSIQKTLPTLDYNQHVFLNSDNSFVEINNEIYKAGNHINNQLSIIKIEESYIVLRFQGTEFRLNALNSWVNFN